MPVRRWRTGTALLAIVFCVFLIAPPEVTPMVSAYVGDPCEGDIDGDGQVGILDLIEVLFTWGACPDKGECPADLDGDGFVGVNDLIIVLINFGPCDGEGCQSHADCDDGDDCTIDFCIAGLCFNIPIWGCE